MATEKILTQVKSFVTGETYYIGTTGSQEKVAIKLTSTNVIDWSNYQVQLQNISDGSIIEYNLNEDGECLLSVPMGTKYGVILPVINGYKQPTTYYYTASLASRSIDYSYISTSNPSLEEHDEILQIRGAVNIINQADNISVLEGHTVTIQDINSDTIYTAVFDNQGVASTIIPRGVQYTVSLPTVTSNNEEVGELHMTPITGTFIAGNALRTLVAHYYKYYLASMPDGVYGVDASANVYTIEEIDADVTIANSIVAGMFKHSDLIDGDRDLGFMWNINQQIVSKQWATQNVQFDTTLLPNLSNHNLAYPYKDGRTYTGYMLSEAARLGITSPAAEFAVNSALTLGNVTRTGFVLAYGQIKRLAENFDSVTALYLALGKDKAPFDVRSGYWWSSCQFNATGAVYLYNGGFYYYRKTGSISVLVGFDL